MAVVIHIHSAQEHKIFRRNETQVETIEDMKALMRYNNYVTDPLSHGDPGNAISSRFDLERKGGSPFGGTDSKVTNVALSSINQCQAIYGPTSEQVPAFSWANWNDWPHVGMPTVCDFAWELMDPTN